MSIPLALSLSPGDDLANCETDGGGEGTKPIFFFCARCDALRRCDVTGRLTPAVRLGGNVVGVLRRPLPGTFHGAARC